MKAAVVTSPGGPEVLQVREVEEPAVREGEVLIRVAAAGLNRADTLQREGFHPPPPGTSSYPGVECSGVVEAVGKGVQLWKVGDQVCALLAGGGYAEKVAVPAGQVLPIPPGVALEEAAGLPEVACTVWSTVFMMSYLSPGESFLIHGGSSGIGTFAIQIAKHLGVRVLVTAGSAEKLEFCRDLGADVCINYKTEDFVARVKEETEGKGVDVILDTVGGPYLQRNLESLSTDGRLFIIGFQGGTVTEVNLGPLLAKRLTIQAAGLRNRSTENKARIVAEVENHVWPAIAAGKVKPVIYKSFPLSEAAEAHKLMDSACWCQSQDWLEEALEAVLTPLSFSLRVEVVSPTDDKVKRLGITLCSKCVCYSNHNEETDSHLFLHSNLVTSVWALFADLFDFIPSSFSSCMDLGMHLLSICHTDKLVLVVAAQ